MNRYVTLRTRILHLTPQGARICLGHGAGTALEDLRDLETIQAIVLEALPGSADIPRPVERQLARMFDHVPVFAVHSGDPDCPLAAWATEHATIFDRLVLPPGLPVPAFPLSLVLAPGTPLIEAVVEDLRAEMAADHDPEPDDTPAAHWEARAQRFGTSGRAVCQVNAPRIVNKARHKVQIEALVPAIARAAAHGKRGSLRPSLMEFGCGIGRLAPHCTPYVRYFGADLSRGMIDTARTINSGIRFFTTPTLATAALPEIDIVLTVAVLQHNDRAARLKLLNSAAGLAGRRVRLVLLEDMIGPARNGSPPTYPLSIESLHDEVTTAFGGTCTQTGFELLSYKPNDLIPRTGLIELDVWR